MEFNKDQEEALRQGIEYFKQLRADLTSLLEVVRKNEEAWELAVDKIDLDEDSGTPLVRIIFRNMRLIDRKMGGITDDAGR